MILIDKHREMCAFERADWIMGKEEKRERK